MTRDPKDIPIIFSGPMVRAIIAGEKTMTRRIAYQPRCGFKGKKNPLIDGAWTRVQPGARLWVRECFSGPREWEGIPPGRWGWDAMKQPPIWYWADGNPEDGDWTKPKPSIHCPRWASRLTLIVEAVKREPLQSISIADAIAEGIPATAPIVAFIDLWRKLHGRDAWEENPEVVAISFRVIKANIDSEEVRKAA